MSIPHVSVLLALVFSSVAFADEVDFYQFRTTHTKYADAEKTTFYSKVVQTNLVDRDIDESDEVKCHKSPANPGNFSCKVAGEWLYLADTIESALTVLTRGYTVSPQD